MARADAPAEVVGRVRLENPGQIPIRFEIPYDPHKIEKGRSYSRRFRVIGRHLELFDDDGTTVARLEERNLRGRWDPSGLACLPEIRANTHGTDPRRRGSNLVGQQSRWAD